VSLTSPRNRRDILEEQRRPDGRRELTPFSFQVLSSARHHSPLQLRLLILSLFDTGVLSCLDGYMNIALEQTEEYVNGVLTNSYGDAFVRGNNGASGTV
jgi:hypothetical protein